jgi:glutamyl-tRNA reductase
MQIDSFFVAGINYKKTDAAVRGQFALQPEDYTTLLEKSTAVKEVFVISTCNRTEIYGIAASPHTLIDTLTQYTTGSQELFLEKAYIKQGYKAVEHLFHVAAGLDSQILGDYEITGQLKQAVAVARKHNRVGAFLERLTNTALQSSKAIRSKTQLSGGTVSVAFAAISFLKQHVQQAAGKKILLVGTGKIGRNTCKNLLDYTDANHITLVNRTEAKALELAREMQLRTAPFAELDAEIAQADVIIVSTNAPAYLVRKEQLKDSTPKVLIDLSVPNNIDPAVAGLPGTVLANVDDLSKINDATLAMRAAEVPKAGFIIQEFIKEFDEWLGTRRHAPMLQYVKQTLSGLQECPFLAANTTIVHNDAAINRAVKNMAVMLKESNNPGCRYFEVLNDYLAEHSVDC